MVWPGIRLPIVRAVESGEKRGMIRIAWDDPVISGNGKIAFYRVIAESEDTGEQVIEGSYFQILISYILSCRIYMILDHSSRSF